MLLWVQVSSRWAAAGRRIARGSVVFPRLVPGRRWCGRWQWKTSVWMCGLTVSSPSPLRWWWSSTRRTEMSCLQRRARPSSDGPFSSPMRQCFISSFLVFCNVIYNRVSNAPGNLVELFLLPEIYWKFTKSPWNCQAVFDHLSLMCPTVLVHQRCSTFCVLSHQWETSGSKSWSVNVLIVSDGGWHCDRRRMGLSSHASSLKLFFTDSKTLQILMHCGQNVSWKSCLLIC